jgi:beta-lactamase superfamily II metal-dependent hydrolase
MELSIAKFSMRAIRCAACLCVAYLAVLAGPLPAAKDLEIYTIDVEGGKCVLTVSPSGQTMLVDLGWPEFGGRAASADHIIESIRAAGVKRIDNLVISHFDIDHIGDATQFVSKFPVGHIFDHGDIRFPETSDPRAAKGVESAKARFAAYAAVREKIGHTVLKPGDRIPIKGVDVQVISAGGEPIPKPVAGAGAANPLCAAATQPDLRAGDIEDDQSIALLYTFGKFRMFDPADLEAHYSHDLVCPNNLIGTVDVYHLNVHGQFKGVATAMLGALHAPVIVEGNGERKGADAETWPLLKAAPGLVDIWQIHYSENAGKDRNPPDDFLANLQGTDGLKAIKISAESNGTFTVTNERNGFSKTYNK